MKVFEAIKKRRSVRKFKHKAVEERKIKKLLEAARWAPTAGNLQSFYFYLVKSKKLKSRLASACLNQEFISEAPIVFVACADTERSASVYGSRGKNLYALQDATIATQNMFLAAVEMGLAACWVGAFDERGVSETLSIPHKLRPVAVLPVGYPSKAPEAPQRRKISEIYKLID